MPKKDTASKVFIALGSNLGCRLSNLNEAVARLDQHEHITRTSTSSIYETDPVDTPTPQAPYFNAVIEITTALTPLELLAECRGVEELLKRTRTVQNGPRTIDLDILLFGCDSVTTDRLTVPHPRMHLRRFVLEPLVEIAPSAVHPHLHQTASELLDALPPNGPMCRRLPIANWGPSLPVHALNRNP